jgi:hypothetical protein
VTIAGGAFVAVVYRVVHHRIGMTTLVVVVVEIVVALVLRIDTVAIEVVIGTMTIEDVGIDLPLEEEVVAVVIEVALLVGATVVGAAPGQGRLGGTARGVLLVMVVRGVVVMTTVIGVLIGVLGMKIIGIEALRATVNGTDIEEGVMIADIVLESNSNTVYGEQHADYKLTSEDPRNLVCNLGLTCCYLAMMI